MLFSRLPRTLPLLFALLFSFTLFSQPPGHPAAPQPDSRFKADILVVVAHPDDEGMVIGYLAKAVLDLHKRVAIVYGTRGDGGGNAIGLEQAGALGAEREMEARRAVAAVGISNVWFLGAPDTPGQNVLRSLETWNHGSALGQVVRLVRLTRPDIVMTWLPAYSAGENHGDHQAAAVLATEAFDMAADATMFPEQVTPTRDHARSGSLTEGLLPWQPRKLYFFSDAANVAALDGKGPQYPWSEISPSRHVAYGQLALESIANHLTQDYPGLMAAEALKKGDLSLVSQMRTRLVLGKSLGAEPVTGDIFEGVTAAPLAFQRVSGYAPESRTGLSAELGGPWAFYRQFWKAHDLPGVHDIFMPEVRVGVSAEVSIPVLLHNDTDASAVFSVTAATPSGWGEARGIGSYPVRLHESLSVDISIPTPAKETSAQPVNLTVSGPSGKVAEVSVAVSVASGGLPQ
jgi:LmbE family N-acetylglucosaminyl deacetylase